MVERGPDYRVTRVCCIAGNCRHCERLPHGERARLVLVDRVNRDEATFVSRQWRDYGAQIEEFRDYACDACGRGFRADPKKVPTAEVDGERLVICASCAASNNRIASQMGMPGVLVEEGAYPEDE